MRKSQVIGENSLMCNSYLPEQVQTGWPEILFIPGAALNAECFNEVALRLSEQGICAHALSLRGHTPSGGNARFATARQYVKDIETTLTRLNLGKPVLVGHSAGGWYAQLYAQSHPVAGLCLLNSCSAHRARAVSARSQKVVLSIEPRPTLASLIRPELLFEHPARLRALLLGASAPDSLVEWTRSHVLCAESALVAVDQFRMERAGMRPVQTAHLLVLAGEADALVGVQDATDTAADYGAPHVIIPGGPHNMMQTHAHAVAEQLVRFCQTCVGSE